MANSNPPTPGPIVVPPPPPPGLPETDDERAVRFMNDWLNGDYKFIYNWKQWAHWNGNGWKLDPTGRHEFSILNEAREFGRDLMDQALAMPAGAQQNAAISAARKAKSTEHMLSMIKLVKSDCEIHTDITDFDANPMLIGVQNGVVDLETGEFREVEKEDLILKKCGVNFDAAARCPMWEEFLEQVLPDADVRAYVRRAIGYALTGKTTEQVLFFFYGMGQNGKSTFIDTIEHLFGQYALRTSAELFIEAKAAENKMQLLSTLPEMRFVVGAEMPEGAHLAENRIKDLTGGDRIQARKLFCEPFNFYPTHKLFFYGNHRPMVRGTDQGIWRRINLIPFNIEIPEEKRDRNIVARLWTEASGILNWAIAGCLEWQKMKLSPPESVRYATNEYRAEEDLFGQFVEAEMVMQGRISRQQLSANFELWAKACGYKFTLSPRAINDRVRRLPGVGETKQEGVRYWTGLSMKEPTAFRNKVQ
jgi:putative DNA primase/helicase